MTSLPGYAASPLIGLDGLAAHLDLEGIWLKDESERFGLGSFKPLGGAYAVFELARGVTEPGALTVASATDGNHGRAVAWGAQQVGCRCVIYLHEEVSSERERAISRYGADIVRTSGNYDDSARQCAADAREFGWQIVSDTAGGDDYGVALDVMQGYRILADEALQQLGDRRLTHVWVQAGCGGLAASLLAHLLSEARIIGDVTFVVVEPNSAGCLYRSAEAGERVTVHGALSTVMAGLAVGEVSAPAWEILKPGAHYFQAVHDDLALEAMRLLAAATEGDRPVVAGETGAAGLAGLLAAARDSTVRAELGLTSSSRVLLVNTEGDTDPSIYKEIVGRTAAEVRGS